MLVPVLYGNCKAYSIGTITDDLPLKESKLMLEFLELISKIKVKLSKNQSSSKGTNEIESIPFPIYTKNNK